IITPAPRVAAASCRARTHVSSAVDGPVARSALDCSASGRIPYNARASEAYAPMVVPRNQPTPRAAPPGHPILERAIVVAQRNVDGPLEPVSSNLDVTHRRGARARVAYHSTAGSTKPCLSTGAGLRIVRSGVPIQRGAAGTNRLSGDAGADFSGAGAERRQSASSGSGRVAFGNRPKRVTPVCTPFDPGGITAIPRRKGRNGRTRSWRTKGIDRAHPLLLERAANPFDRRRRRAARRRAASAHDLGPRARCTRHRARCGYRDAHARDPRAGRSSVRPSPDRAERGF